MTIDRDEKCAFCGFPRHAHWGGSQALVAGRCAGFESSAATKLNAAAPHLFAALKGMLARERKRYANTDAGREHFERENADAITAIALVDEAQSKEASHGRD